jgi:hypothetical protein
LKTADAAVVDDIRDINLGGGLHGNVAFLDEGKSILHCGIIRSQTVSLHGKTVKLRTGPVVMMKYS